MVEKRPDVPVGPIVDPKTGKLTAQGQQWVSELIRLLKLLLDDAGL